MSTFATLSHAEQLARLAQAARKALEQWDIKAISLELVKYRENAVYKVKDKHNRAFALRIHRASYHSTRAISSELAWLEALHEANLRVPEVIATTSGQLLASVFVEGDVSPRAVDVFEWLVGSTVAELLPGLSQHEVEALYEKIGQTAALLHKHGRGWQKPEGFWRHSWNMAGLIGDQPFWGRFWAFRQLSSSETRLIRRARQVLHEVLASYEEDSHRYGLIHADMIPDNLMLEQGELILLDFDDAGYGYYLFELATILRPMAHYGLPLSTRSALLQGYQDQADLPPEDLDYLEAFELVRALSYLGWLHERPELAADRARTERAIREAVTRAEAFLER